MYLFPAGQCYVCQHQVGYVCNDCSNQRNQIQFYCSTCSPLWHQNFCNHKHVLDFDTAKLQLLSVLCVKAGHYVCFTRIKDEWVFFDSMAERQGNTSIFTYVHVYNNVVCILGTY